MPFYYLYTLLLTSDNREMKHNFTVQVTILQYVFFFPVSWASISPFASYSTYLETLGPSEDSIPRLSHYSDSTSREIISISPYSSHSPYGHCDFPLEVTTSPLE
jgi:hypothetical protein